jgi:dehydrogenase/reductase SDR family protein 4
MDGAGDESGNHCANRKQSNVEEALSSLRAQGIQAVGIPCHVGSAEQRQALIQAAVKVCALGHILVCLDAFETCLAYIQEYGHIDILVSNAAVNPSTGRIVDTSPEAIDKILDINIKVTDMSRI